MFLDPILVPLADFTRLYVVQSAILKSRQRQCPPGLVREAIVDKLGRRMTVCVRPAPPEHLADPFHTARRKIDGAKGILRLPSPTGHQYIGVGEMPDRTTLGENLGRLQHPLEHFGTSLHYVPLDPESDPSKHDPEQAYHLAMGKQIVRGSDGEAYGVGQVTGRDAKGKPTGYRLLRLPKYVFFGTTRAANDPDSLHRGSGIDLSPAEFEYLRAHPPKNGVAAGANGEVFATYSRIALPAVDSDGRAVPGRPLQVRYDLKLHPSVYGGEEAFRSLQMLPYRKFKGDEAKTDRHFERYLDKARRKFFEHIQNRPPSGPVEELLRQHNGDVEQLVASGDLGHENVLRDSRTRKQRTFRPAKPIGERGIAQLVMHWKAQHPTAVDSLKAQAERQYPVLDEAVLDDAIERGIGNAIHRFDPKRSTSFRAFARHTALGEVAEAVRQSGATYGAERLAAHDDVFDPRSEDDERDDENEPGGDDERDEERQDEHNDERQDEHDDKRQDDQEGDDLEAPGPSRRRQARPSRQAARDAAFQPNGSQAEFRQALAQVYPEDPKAQEVISALHPTGDIPAGAHLMEASRLTGLSLDELGKYRPLVERLKTHPAYRRYYEKHLRDVDEKRDELNRSLRSGRRQAARVQRYHNTLTAIRGEQRVAALVNGRGRRRSA